MATLTDLLEEVEALKSPASAAIRARFFQTGPGQYAEGDQFLGLTVPQQRTIAKRYRALSLDEVAKLLRSPIHEHRFIALAILVLRYNQTKGRDRQAVVDCYLAHFAYINNWDLVDASAPYILGCQLRSEGYVVLEDFAHSEHLWTRRIAIVATLGLLKAGKVDPTYRIATILLGDPHPLIHKAVGWALREAGRIDRSQLLTYLRDNYAKLPRTALRYAIEHLSPEQRKAALQGNFAGRRL